MCDLISIPSNVSMLKLKGSTQRFSNGCQNATVPGERAAMHPPGARSDTARWETSTEAEIASSDNSHLHPQKAWGLVC